LILRIRIALPFDEVLQLVPSSKTPRGHDSLHFILLLSVDKVRWGLIVVGAVKLCLAIRGQEVHMKHGVQLPLHRETELIGDGR
jgi:hypothetical protein